MQACGLPEFRRTTGFLLRSADGEQGLELPPLQGGLGGVGHLGEVGHQRGGLPYRVVLAEGDEIDVPAVEQGAQIGGGANQPIVGGGARRRGRPLRRWALAAMVTLVSVMLKRPACSGCCPYKGR